MLFKKSMRLSVSTTPLMLKSVLCQCIIIALVLGLMLLLVSPLVEKIIDIAEDIEISANIQKLVEIIYDNPQADSIKTQVNLLIDDVMEVFERAGGLFSSLAWAYVGIILAMLVYRFLLSIIDYPVMASMTEFMQTSVSRSFIWYFVKKFGKSVVFSICQLMTVIWLDLFVVFGTVGMYLLLLSPLGGVGVAFAVVLFIMSYSVRLAFYSCWLPEYVLSGSKVFTALASSFAFSIKRFWNIWYKIAVIITVMLLVTYGINVLLDLVSCPAYITSLVVALVSFYAFYLVKCVGATEYFYAQDKPFFTKHLRLSENSDSADITIA